MLCNCEVVISYIRANTILPSSTYNYMYWPLTCYKKDSNNGFNRIQYVEWCATNQESVWGASQSTVVMDTAAEDGRLSRHSLHWLITYNVPGLHMERSGKSYIVFMYNSEHASNAAPVCVNFIMLYVTQN